MSLQRIDSIREMQECTTMLRGVGKTIGFVPTMGYLHEGHASLMHEARKQGADTLIVSIFVNPTQFAPHEDYARYPRDIERDSAFVEKVGADILFVPDVQEMYPAGSTTSIHVDELTSVLEGEFRPSHFDGVATVVAKLFNIVRPDFAVFGQKDYQQCLVVRRMVRDLNIPVQIIVAPTMREPDGLAMSSRNIYLSGEQRSRATVLYRALQAGKALIESGEAGRAVIEQSMQMVLHTVPELQREYAVAADALTLAEREYFAENEDIVLLIAARLGTTRLIDNEVIVRDK